MDFSPNNPVVKRCLQGMTLEDQGKPEEASCIFYQAWDEARNDFEKYMVAFYVARHQNSIPERLKWLETMLQLALKIHDDTVQAALQPLYLELAACYEKMDDAARAAANRALAGSCNDKPSDKGPFYHGTRADLHIGDVLTPGGRSNYQADLSMNHIYFTALINGAGLAASLAKGKGRQRVYIVQPTGDFENDPNVTNKKFPGNPTRSYRSRQPLEIVGEATEWVRQTPEQRKTWAQKLADNKGDIVN